MNRIVRSLAALAASAALFVSLTAPASADGSEPTADNLELNAISGRQLRGRLSASDPDDDVVSFEITTKPVRGTITVFADGSFVYYTSSRRNCRDYFGYRAVDAQGNRSQEATAIIRIEKR